ncbi:unnamed protein product [Cladocopium goreaui]|uniref:Uncharacterized protein n=1 Tax=Cladocopium goreaui TaxID=2562237 RepID=A0A9P1GBE9_9DINO|nr:unnamed protein product [Cladocopium goreaui]|mmetsp:Transcript_27683/g.60290  ORF Transcript_27683/g.60290 Transcript_27683/m.60290 type:complete len:352 (-) Transcript_27683:9-1064(-)
MLKPRWNKGIAAEDAGNSDGPGGRGRKVPARLLTSQLCNAGERIAKLCEQLHFWQDQSQDLQHDLRLKLAQKAAVDARHERRGALARRLQKLQGDLRQRREGLQRLKDFPAATSGRLELHALQACASLRDRQKLLDPEQLLRAQEMLQELQGQQEATKAELLEATRSLQKSWQRLRCQQIRKLYEVRQVYPVQQCNSYWTIRGICLRGLASLRHQDPREEREASTALGYLSHLLASAASLLQVPLQLELNRVGSSRAFVVDPNGPPEASRTLSKGRPFAPTRERRAEGEWPLHYGRAIEKTQFDTALRLLEQSLHQFLYSRGYRHQKAQGDNLLKCADVIFCQEIYAGESP